MRPPNHVDDGRKGSRQSWRMPQARLQHCMRICIDLLDPVGESNVVACHGYAKVRCPCLVRTLPKVVSG